MKRARLRGPKELDFEDLPLDRDNLADDEIYAETEFSAVSSGTESAAYAGLPPLRPEAAGYPRLMGYCNAAVVQNVGHAVQGIEVGDRLLTNNSHQSAFICKSSDVLAQLPDSLPSRVACLIYLAELGLATLQRAEFRPGEHVAILGLGVIGLATVNVASALGAQVIALGNDDSRLERARDLGAEAYFRSDDAELKARIDSVTGEIGIDLLVTTANTWDAWRTALDVVRTRGRIAVLGFPGRAEGAPSFNPLDPFYFYAKQLTIYATGSVSEMHVAPTEIRFSLHRNMQLLTTMAAQGRIHLERLITHCVPWYALASIYELALAKDKAMVGAVLDWSK